jgi:hypothetical protein
VIGALAENVDSGKNLHTEEENSGKIPLAE